MKLECMLEKVVETETSKGYTYSYLFIPVKKPYDEYVKLVISGKNATETLENLELPNMQGDNAMVDFSPKQSQSKLVKK